MLQFVIQDLLEREDIEQIRDVVKSAAAESNTKNSDTIVAIRKQLDAFATKGKRDATKATHILRSDDNDVDSDGEYNDANREDETVDEEADNIPDYERKATGALFGKEYNFKPYFNSLTVGEKWESKRQRAQCGSCNRSPPVDPWQTSCGHLLCHDCYANDSVAAAEQDIQGTVCKVKDCRKTFTYARQVDDMDPVDMGPETRARRKRNDREREKIEQQDISEDWLNSGSSKGVLPSAKTIAIKAQLLNWIAQNKDVKVIIYTQFIAM
jgi:hypothetical protein